MAINKKLIHFQKLATFKLQLAANNILDTSIVFIKDSLLIWTHGQYYSITDAPADGNSYVRKNNGWVLSPSSEAEIYIGKDEPSSKYKVWFNTEDGSLYYYNKGWTSLYYGEYIDLSMRDIHGNNRGTATTANCYVIKKKGTYRIPLVYGNAIVNGFTNSASYTKIGINTLNFVNGEGTGINTPFIEKLVAIIDALLSIADTDGIFTDISVNSNPNVTNISNCGYVLFKVTSVPSTGANGVISVKNSSGTIIWNWHIWVWEDDLSPISIINSSGVTYKILPYNLASKWDDTGKTKIKNWFYQWGRSVPMLCPRAYNSDNNDDSNSYGNLILMYSSEKARYYEYGIANPTIFYCNMDNPYNWFSSNIYYNLWDANCTTTGTSDNMTVKTIYDPCPPGFKIPNGNTFTGFSKSNGGSFNNGYIWNDAFFPASGFRINWDASLRDMSYKGYVWTSATKDLDYAHILYFYNNTVSPLASGKRSYGYSVRPAAES